jgi:DNA-nicking Smr family endonuclease
MKQHVKEATMKKIWRTLITGTKNAMADMERKTLERNRKRHARAESVCDMNCDDALCKRDGNEKKLSDSEKASLKRNQIYFEEIKKRGYV